MDYVISAYLVLLNLFGILDVWLLLKIFFGCDLRLNKKNMLISAMGFVVFDVMISLIFSRSENNVILLQILLIYGYIFFGTLVLAKTKRLKTLVLTIPAVLVYVQIGSISELLEKLFLLDPFYAVIEYWRGLCRLISKAFRLLSKSI